MTVLITTSLTPKPGKEQEAMKLAAEAAEYLSGDTYNGTVQAVRSLDGVIPRLHWIGYYDSLGDHEKNVVKRRTDPVWQEKYGAQFSELYEPGTEWHYYEVVE